MGQHVRAALRVVHQGFDTADDRRVDAAFWRLVVHTAQEVEEAGEAVQLNEACDKPGGEKKKADLDEYNRGYSSMYSSKYSSEEQHCCS